MRKQFKPMRRVDPKKWAKDAGSTAIAILIALIFVIAMVVIFMAQFEIYQKKYGDDMTVVDYLIDSGK